jgi:hypothetical protein
MHTTRWIAVISLALLAPLTGCDEDHHKKDAGDVLEDVRVDAEDVVDVHVKDAEDVVTDVPSDIVDAGTE